MKLSLYTLSSCLSSCLSSPVLWPPGAQISSPPALSLSSLSSPPLPHLVLQSHPLPPLQSPAVHLPPLSAEYQVPYRPSITFLDPPTCTQCQYQCEQCQLCQLHQEAGQEVECEPVTRQLCSALPTFLTSQDKVCDTVLETVCTTIIATKYVKSCSSSPYGGRECSHYPVQKPVKKCAEVPKQTCLRSRLKHKCRTVTQNVCREVAVYKPTEKCETFTGVELCSSGDLTCTKTEKVCEKVSSPYCA